MIEPIKGTESSDPRSQEDKFWEAEYKLQNCLRITLNVENFKTEVEYLPEQFQEVAKYVEELIALRERQARIDELSWWWAYSTVDEATITAMDKRINELKKGEE
jgi:hypothetical protein